MHHILKKFLNKPWVFIYISIYYIPCVSLTSDLLIYNKIGQSNKDQGSIFCLFEVTEILDNLNDRSLKIGHLLLTLYT